MVANSNDVVRTGQVILHIVKLPIYMMHQEVALTIAC